MHGRRKHGLQAAKALLLIPLFSLALFYLSASDDPEIKHVAAENIVEDRMREGIYIPSQENHLTCDHYNIDEDVKATKNPEHYLEYTLEGDRYKGGSLVRDMRHAQDNLAITVCGHNLDEKDKKFSNIADVWQEVPQEECVATYYDGQSAQTYRLWGSYRIDATDVDIAYPNLNNAAQLKVYLTQLTHYEGWNRGISTQSVKSIMILLTCSESQRNAPHRTIVIFAA